MERSAVKTTSLMRTVFSLTCSLQLWEMFPKNDLNLLIQGVNSSSKLPVLFYIHGGGWVDGSGAFGSGIYPNLVNRGPLVMVSINYRLGPFGRSSAIFSRISSIWGFFTSREDTIPGNFAISDMIESLNWAKRYISFFGGDPGRITIDGHRYLKNLVC